MHNTLSFLGQVLLAAIVHLILIAVPIMAGAWAFFGYFVGYRKAFRLMFVDRGRKRTRVPGV